jgi:hypothetical protein
MWIEEQLQSIAFPCASFQAVAPTDPVPRIVGVLSLRELKNMRHVSDVPRFKYTPVHKSIPRWFSLVKAEPHLDILPTLSEDTGIGEPTCARFETVDMLCVNILLGLQHHDAFPHAKHTQTLQDKLLLEITFNTNKPTLDPDQLREQCKIRENTLCEMTIIPHPPFADRQYVITAPSEVFCLILYLRLTLPRVVYHPILGQATGAFRRVTIKPEPQKGMISPQ